MMCGMPCPRYVSSITFENQSGKNVDIEVHFNSGQIVHYNVENVPVFAKRQIDHGSFSTIDIIQNFNVNFGEGQVTNVSCQDAAGIEKRTYVIQANNLIERKAN